MYSWFQVVVIKINQPIPYSIPHRWGRIKRQKEREMFSLPWWNVGRAMPCTTPSIPTNIRSGANAAIIRTVLVRPAFAARFRSVIPTTLARYTLLVLSAISAFAIALLPGAMSYISHDRSSPVAIGPRLAHLVSPGAPSARLARAPSSSRPSASAHLRSFGRTAEANK